jgi:cyclopropane fatty-acyl-phospholipid synthase-like methyltransferase
MIGEKIETTLRGYSLRSILWKDMEILDVGIGAGRTTPHLAVIAARYVGIDCSEVCSRG